MYISEIRTKAPADERMPLERKFYDTLEKLKIPYEQVDNDPASSMEECAEVDKAIGTEIRKNVFLCNQKKTTFFLLVMPADKAFDTSSEAGRIPYVIRTTGEDAGTSWYNTGICKCCGTSDG